MTDTLSREYSYAEDLLKEISANTDSWFDFSSSFTSIVTILASIITILGFVTLLIEVYNRKIRKDCLRLVIKDLIRHFFINNAIAELIRRKVQESGGTIRPNDGVLSRFSTLDMDIDLGKFAVNAKNYEQIHEISLKLRNYNSVAANAEAHFADADTPLEEKLADLREIFERSIALSEELVTLGVQIKLWHQTDGKVKKARTKAIRGQSAMDDVKDYINERYDRELSVKKNGNTASYPESVCGYYESIGLGTIFGRCIADKEQTVRFTGYRRTPASPLS